MNERVLDVVPQGHAELEAKYAEYGGCTADSRVVHLNLAVLVR